MFFDSHAHLNFKAFQNDYRQVIKRCQENDVRIINVGSQYETGCRAVEIASEYEKGVWAAIGLHPIHVDDENFDYQKYLALAKSSLKVVVIGETGLDYYRGPDNKSKQKEIFLKHLELARELNKPVIIHCREAYDDLIKILEEIKNKPAGVIHCFSGNLKQAKKYLEMGFYLGFTGIITYSPSYDKIIKTLPLDKILIETDSPYLAPAPYRGQRNEPIYVKYMAEKIAAVRGLSLETAAEQTAANALKLFML